MGHTPHSHAPISSMGLEPGFSDHTTSSHCSMEPQFLSTNQISHRGAYVLEIRVRDTLLYLVLKGIVQTGPSASGQVETVGHGRLYIIQVLRRAGSKPPGYLPQSVMASSNAQIMMLFFTLAGSLVLASGFFLPNWSSPFSKKPEATNSWATSQMLQQDYHHGQGYALGAGAALPLAVPYPVPVPAQVQVSTMPHPSPLSLSSLQSQAYHNMQLVPCLCSVPKDEIDDSGSVVVQSSQPIGN
ncbi:uncharacterized protein [Anabrus simplex]|uniref:uncharacterized protein n=1 Tax=Anabrus simplex TaxID=316456 RepID=UPI0035A39BC1